MHLIATRPLVDSEKLKQRLEAQQHTVSIAPLLTIETDERAEIPDLAWQAMLVTSANALTSLAEGGVPARLKSVQVMAIGPAAHKSATELGFAKVTQSDGGDLAALTALCRKLLEPEKGPLLYLSGKVRSGDLAGDLAQHGFETALVEIYDALPAQQLPPGVEDLIRDYRVDGVVLYSPRTASIWADLIQQAGLEQAAANIIHLCLSDNVAKRLRETSRADFEIVVASKPNDDAMLDLVNEISSRRKPDEPIKGERSQMANRKSASRKASKRTRPTVIDATATEVNATSGDTTEAADATPCKPADVAAANQVEKAEPLDEAASADVKIEPDADQQTTEVEPGQQPPVNNTGSGKGKLVAAGLAATLLAGIAGGGYLYSQYGQSLFGNPVPSASLGAIEGQAIEAIGAAQSAGETASNALSQTKALSEQVSALEAKIAAVGNAGAGPDEETAAALKAASELAASAKTDVENLATRVSGLEQKAGEMETSVSSIKTAVESAASSGGGIDQADLNLKIEELSQRIVKLEAQPADSATAAPAAELATIGEQLSASNDRVAALEAKLEEMGKAPPPAQGDTTVGINTADITQQISAMTTAINAGEPYLAELTKLEQLIEQPLNLPALTSNASGGVQTAEQLKKSLAEINTGSTPQTTGASGSEGVWNAIVGKVSSIVKVRKLTENDWPGKLAQARAAFETSGPKGAIGALDTNNASNVPEQVSAWLIGARKRVAVETEVQQIPNLILGRLPAQAQ